MPFYQRLGDLPRKRHVQFRENGTLLTEEVMGLEGFTGNESILYHLQSPCRVMELGGFEPIAREEWVPEQHGHLHFKTFDTEPGGDEISGRRLLMSNNDVEISLCRPSGSMDYFFRNGEGDEVIFVHEGSGTLETIFGDLPYTHGDYVVVPRGTTYRFKPDGPQRYLVFEPQAVPIPYHHSNLQSEEMIYYVSGNFGSRKGVEIGSITLHPSGLPHGPQPGLAEKAIGMHETHELAVMCDTFNPLKLTKFAQGLDDGIYWRSCYADAQNGDQPEGAAASGVGLTSRPSLL